MDPEFEIEPEDLKEDIIEDYEPFEREMRKRHDNSPGEIYQNWYFIVPIGLLVIILIVLFFRSGKNIPDKQLGPLISGMEDIKKDMTDLEDRIKKVQQSVAELEKSKAAVSRGMDKLNNRVERLAKGISSASEKIQELSAAKRVSDSGVKKRYYEVRRGDTLFGIAKKVNISLDKLCRLNGLNKAGNIIPGQKLLVE